jgi:serine/threonine protein kinase
MTPRSAARATPPTDALLIALQPRYMLEREVGRGGMATVYRALDTATGDTVAVKVMHAHLVETIGIERFLREVEIAGALRHPRIVPLLASGATGDVLYYVMPFVHGESLGARLDRERRLPLDQALWVAADVAEALDFAHRNGVLHRDVKPENVMLTGERAVVLDFGLARAIGEANYRRLTETGIIVGTAFYMSPEQLREDRDLDQRADLYALGCLVYEMLSGEPPYTGRSIAEIVGRILKAPIPSVARLREDVPAVVDHAIQRALSKRATDRFATAAEFAASLCVNPS